MNKELIGFLYMKATRLWLMCILLFLPFQFRIVKYIRPLDPFWGSLLDKLEEITIIVFLPLAIIQFIISRDKNNYKYLVLAIPFALFFASGLMSGYLLGNSFLITLHGTFDYIKYFLAIFIYAAFFREFSDFKKVFRFLLMMVVFLGAVAFIQEIWAVGSRYILEKDIADHSMYVLSDVPKGGWRFWVYRAPSLIGHYNIMGLYSLLVLTVYMSMKKKLNPLAFLFMYTGVFVSVSRMIYASFLLVAGFQIAKRRWIVLLASIPIVIMVFLMSSLPDFDMLNLREEQAVSYADDISATDFPEDQIVALDEIPYRVEARKKGLEVWMDHPFWGVGPGMFGSAVAYKYQSPVYEEYNFTSIFRWIRSLDQFWPQVLAETGLIGTVAFTGLLLVLFLVFAVSASETVDDELRGLFIGLMMFMIVLNIYSLGGTFNHPVILFSYSSLAGMALGCEEQEKTECRLKNQMRNR